jgi:LysR family transcriptional regulator (chromosome initiation inhibitor)
MPPVELHHLAALAAVVDEESFEAAADALRITPPAVSQRIKALETSVGQVLVRRARPVTVTDAGAPYLRLARQVAALVHDTEVEVAGTDPASAPAVVPVAINSDSLGTWVLEALAPLSGTVRFDIHREDQDHSAALLRDGTVMAAVTTASRAVQGCSVSRLGVMTYRVVASRAFADRWFADRLAAGGPTPASLQTAPVVVFDRKDDLQDAYLRARAVSPAAPPRSYVPSSADFADAVRLGMGWGLLPDQQCLDDLRSGTLVELDPDHRTDVTLYWQQWSLRTAALDQTSSAVHAAAARHLR